MGARRVQFNHPEDQGLVQGVGEQVRVALGKFQSDLVMGLCCGQGSAAVQVGGQGLAQNALADLLIHIAGQALIGINRPGSGSLQELDEHPLGDDDPGLGGDAGE